MFALTRSGSLGTVWLAAHVERRLVKSRVRGTNISVVVDEIIQPENPYSLRVSAYLLLGITRIYSRQTDYILTLSQETLDKLKKTKLLTVQSPETSPGFPLLEPNDILDVENLLDCFSDEREHVVDDSAVALHVSLPEQITLHETHDHGSSNFHFELDERFPEGNVHLDFEFEGAEPLSRCQSNNPSLNLCIEQEAPEAETYTRRSLHVEIDAEQIEPLTPSRETPCMIVAQSSSGEERSEYFEPRTPSPDDLVRPSCERTPTARASLKFCESPVKRTAENIEAAENTLAPVTPKQPCDRSRTFKKRKRVVLDTQTMLSSEALQNQLACAEDLLRPVKRAPCTYRELFDAQKLTSKDDRFSKFSVAEIYGEEHNAWNMTPTRSFISIFAEGLENATGVEEVQSSELQAPAAGIETCTASFVNTFAEVSQVLEIAAEVQEMDSREPQATTSEPETCTESDACNAAYDRDKNGYTVDEFETCDFDDRIEECTDSGWSSRTKAVALYMKESIKKSSTGNTKLGRILGSATKKRAACTFFDLLVLTTKGCVRVEQASPFDDIIISPLDKLAECT